MEEWRSLIIDSMVLSLIQGNEITKEQFEQDDESGGVFLTKEGMKIFLEKYETKLRTESTYLTYSAVKQSYRHAIMEQCGHLVKAIQNNNYSLYEPITIR